MKKNVKHFLFLSIFAGTGIHIFNRMVNRTACMKEVLSFQIGQYYEWKYGQIYYTKSEVWIELEKLYEVLYETEV